MTSEVREQIIQALMNAAVHASGVVSRSSVVAERAVRIGEFVTSLRRELPHGIVKQGRYSKTDGLCQPSMWSDVLVLELGIASRAHVAADRTSSISGQDLASMVDEATHRLADDDNPLAIVARLQGIEETLKEQEILLRKIEDAGREAEEVMDGFDQLEEKMAREAVEASSHATSLK